MGRQQQAANLLVSVVLVAFLGIEGLERPEAGCATASGAKLYRFRNRIEFRRNMIFDDDFRQLLRALIVWRRDVRSFRADTLPDGLLEDLVGLSCLAPSVGLSEPWRFVRVENETRRAEVRTEFERTNGEALAGYSGEQATLYARLKLAGLDCAPVHLAVFADQSTVKGLGLGRSTMPETLEYSVVGAIVTFWLAARAHGVGVGWVSILDAKRVNAILDVPEGWDLIAYLCVGYPAEESLTPELERAGWEKRTGAAARLIER